jgi:hypothetical protein
MYIKKGKSGCYKVGGTVKDSVEISAEKAKEILKDGSVHGMKLTDKQKGFFGWIAGGGKADGGEIEGAGTAKSDSIKAKVKPGSFIVPEENADIAEAIRGKYLSKKEGKANLKQGGGTPVNLSDGEHMFTPEEKEKLMKYGIDLTELAPNAKQGNSFALGTPEKGVDDISKVIAEIQQMEADAEKERSRREQEKKDKELYDKKFQQERSKSRIDDEKKAFFQKRHQSDLEEYNRNRSSIREEYQSTIDNVSKNKSDAYKKILAAAEKYKSQGPGWYNEHKHEFDKAVADYKNASISLKRLNEKSDAEVANYDKTAVKPEGYDISQLKLPEKKSNLVGKTPEEKRMEELASMANTPIEKPTDRSGVLNSINKDAGAINTTASKGTSKKATKTPTVATSTEDVSPAQYVGEFGGKNNKDLGLPPYENAAEPQDYVNGLIKPTQAKPLKVAQAQEEAIPEQLTPEGQAMYKKTTDVADSKTKLNVEDYIGLAQTGLGLYAMSGEKRPTYQQDADLLSATEQAKQQAQYGFDPTTASAFKRDTESALANQRSFAGQIAGQNAQTARAYSAAATKDYGRSMIDFYAQDARTKMEKQNRMDNLIAQKAAYGRKAFEDKLTAFEQNQQAGSELLNAGIENILGSQNAKRRQAEMDKYFG